MRGRWERRGAGAPTSSTRGASRSPRQPDEDGRLLSSRLISGEWECRPRASERQGLPPGAGRGEGGGADSWLPCDEGLTDTRLQVLPPRPDGAATAARKAAGCGAPPSPETPAHFLLPSLRGSSTGHPQQSPTRAPCQGVASTTSWESGIFFETWTSPSQPWRWETSWSPGD